jgi:hypothetical protein
MRMEKDLVNAWRKRERRVGMNPWREKRRRKEEESE